MAPELTSTTSSPRVRASAKASTRASTRAASSPPSSVVSDDDPILTTTRLIRRPPPARLALLARKLVLMPTAHVARHSSVAIDRRSDGLRRGDQDSQLPHRS